jgi:hypothetical protein
MDRHWQSSLHFCDQGCQVRLTFTQERARQENFSRHAVTKYPEPFMTNVRTESVKGDKGSGLMSKDLLEALVIGEMKGH